MASIIDEFPEFQVSAAITRDTISTTNDITTESSAAVATVNCLFWEGSTAEAYVSQRFRDTTVAAIGVTPGTDIQKNDKVTISSVAYHVLGVDNVGAAGEVIVAALGIFA